MTSALFFPIFRQLKNIIGNLIMRIAFPANEDRNTDRCQSGYETGVFFFPPSSVPGHIFPDVGESEKLSFFKKLSF